MGGVILVFTQQAIALACRDRSVVWVGALLYGHNSVTGFGGRKGAIEFDLCGGGACQNCGGNGQHH